MINDECATRSSFFSGLYPLSAPRPMLVVPGRIWSGDEWARIRAGHVSKGSGEKWNAYVEGDVLHLHRSQTGYGIYNAFFGPTEGGQWKITHALIESDGSRYLPQTDEYDCLVLELVISSILLKEPSDELRSVLTRLTREAAGVPDMPSDVVQYSILGVPQSPSTAYSDAATASTS
ncbi:hypothetical protein ACFCZ1_26115 [Streptomyces sp. NPDC056224]|uniref:hypothetical protein n=1 Tax=Streptomyces sp. NPDC056224 TaxID=3345750 RepID=UPI0035DCBDDF